MVTVPLPQISTTSWFGCEPPSASHEVRLSAGLAGPATVTAPRAMSLTAWVMASCSVYVPPQTLMVAPGAAAASAALIVLKPGLVQLLSVPIGAVEETHSGPERPVFVTLLLKCARVTARVLPRPAGETCVATGRVAAAAPCADKARP